MLNWIRVTTQVCVIQAEHFGVKFGQPPLIDIKIENYLIGPLHEAINITMQLLNELAYKPCKHDQRRLNQFVAALHALGVSCPKLEVVAKASDGELPASVSHTLDITAMISCLTRGWRPRLIEKLALPPGHWGCRTHGSPFL